jgi:hypothetical protein
MRRWGLVLMLILLGCSEDNSDRGLLGPEIDVHCAGQQRTPSGIGDTTVKVECPPQEAQ